MGLRVFLRGEDLKDVGDIHNAAIHVCDVRLALQSRLVVAVVGLLLQRGNVGVELSVWLLSGNVWRKCW